MASILFRPQCVNNWLLPEGTKPLQKQMMAYLIDVYFTTQSIDPNMCSKFTH